MLKVRVRQNPAFKMREKENRKLCRVMKLNFLQLTEAQFVSLHGQAAFVYERRDKKQLDKVAAEARVAAQKVADAAAEAEAGLSEQDLLLKAATELGIDLSGVKEGPLSAPALDAPELSHKELQAETADLLAAAEARRSEEVAA